MKNLLLLLMATGLLLSCSGSRATNTTDTKDISQPIHDTTAQQWWQNKNCPRGVPEATFSAQNPNFVAKSFELTRDGGFESAKLFSGDSLFVSSTGCDYYILTYLLRSYNADAEKGDAAYWYRRAADLLLGLQDSKTPFDYRELSEKLRTTIKPQIGQEIETETGNKGKSFAQITETGKLNGLHGGYMILKLSIGPI